MNDFRQKALDALADPIGEACLNRANKWITLYGDEGRKFLKDSTMGNRARKSVKLTSNSNCMEKSLNKQYTSFNCFFVEVNIKWMKSMNQNKLYYKSAVP